MSRLRDEDPGPLRSSVRIRAARDADMLEISWIYAHHVAHGRASFEEIVPSREEMQSRRQAVLAHGLPYLVAERDGRILGYSYAAPYRSRSAYRFTVEDTVYVADGLAGQGIGSALLGALVSACEAGPWRQMIAVIGDSGNEASIKLHARHGFAQAGLLRDVGFKFGGWVDSVLMQRALGPGAGSAPEAG